MPIGGKPGSGSVLFQIGDIAVTHDRIITPNGEARVAGSTWVVADQSRLEERIPAWAIILTIVFFFACLLGLLFLLVKERKMTGYIEIRVQSGELMHMTQIPARHQGQVDQVRAQVGQIQAHARRAAG